MTREEFNKILSEETDKEIKHVIESIDFSNKDQDEILTESVAQLLHPITSSYLSWKRLEC